LIPDNIIPVAFAVASSPKRYALLLGSGISGSKIRTGKEITRDLIRKIAAASKEQLDGDPLGWYRERYGKEPTFAGLFGRLKAHAGDKEAILREYFTIKDGEGEWVAPEPSPAHREIATMVREGLISLIITTNFDNLMEQALQNEGIQPAVITELSEPEMMSVIPDRCRIIKVNGDYPSTDLKMTPEDLKDYSPELKDYLDRIFSEYGLIICGWSAQDDTGLVRILTGEGQDKERVRRYSTIWCRRKDSRAIPGEVTEALHPSEIEIASADEFFRELYSRIEVLRRYEHKEPMSVSTAVQRVKHTLREPKPELALPDLIHEETDRVLEFVKARQYYQTASIDGREFYMATLRGFEDAAAPLAAMLATVAYYDDGTFADLITDTIVRLVNIPPTEPEISGILNINPRTAQEYNDGLLPLRHFPALLVIYASGIAAVRTRHFNTLEAILRRPKIYRYGGMLQKPVPYHEDVNLQRITGFGSDWLSDQRWVRFGEEGTHRDYLYQVIYTIIQGLIPSQYAFGESLDIFEYLFGLVYLAESDEGDIQEGAFCSGVTPKPLQSRNWYRHSGLPGISLSPPYLPPHIITYLADLKRGAGGTEFFGGDLSMFKKANRKYATGFGIEHPKTGIGSPQGDLL